MILADPLQRANSFNAPLFLARTNPPCRISNPTETNPAPDAENRSQPETIKRHPARTDFYEPPPATSIELHQRHSHWASRRQRIAEALARTCAPINRREAFANCGADAIVMIERKSGRLRINAHHCHDRFCEACQAQRCAIMQQNLAKLVRQGKTLHVVLTWRSEDRPLADQLADLYAAAARLRSRKWWRKRVSGGSQTLEMTWNQETNQWHPHLHLLVHAQWLQLQELSSEWQKVTGHSHRVHVSLVNQDLAAIREVTKYLSKPIHRSIEFLPNVLDECIVSLKGRRLITTFGSWRGTPLLDVSNPDPNEEWRVWGTLHQLCALAAQKDAWARAALVSLSSPIVAGRMQAMLRVDRQGG